MGSKKLATFALVNKEQRLLTINNKLKRNMKHVIFSYSITSRSDEFEIYRKEINKYKQLDHDDLMALLDKAQNGSKEALDKAVESNLKFVISVAKRYQGLGLDFEDLVCEGNIGLIKACENFDTKGDTKFTTYAIEWIRKYIMKSWVENGKVVRLPANLAISCSNLSTSTSMDAPIGNDDNDKKCLGDTFSTPYTRANKYDEEERVAKLMQAYLSEKEIIVISMRLGLGIFENECTNLEIVEFLHKKYRYQYTEERVRQIYFEGLAKLKKHFPMR